LEKEVRYMETLEAIVEEENDKFFIRIGDASEGIRIPMSEDKPNEVKSVFNKILLRLKQGRIEVNLTDVGNDLFSQVASEYIKQLNRELQEVYGEMEQYGLVEKSSNTESEQ